jgi:hypothetical protein
MNGRRDIERTLDIWLVDGPSVMPDRLFDAVLDRVERTPQRRFARLTLRLTDMNPRFRLYTLAAAGLVVALVGLYLFNRASPNVNVGSSPSVPATPTAPASTAMPAALEGIWIGEPRALAGLDEDAGRVLTFRSNGDAQVTASANDPAIRLRSTIAAAGSGRVTFTSKPGDPDCQDGNAGAYTWMISADGQTLTLAADGADACAVRAPVVAGSWELVDCPTADDNCLGTIAAGTHASHFFDHVTGGAAWTPRYAAMTYTVPEGWVNVEDWPDYYRLAPTPADANPDSFIFFARDIVLSSRADLCSDSQDPDAGTSAEAIARSLSAQGLVASTPEPVTIGGLAGFRVDLALDVAATACPFSEGVPHQELFTDRDVAQGFSIGIQAEEHARVYLLEVEPSRALVVMIVAPTLTRFDAFLNEATTVVESLTFNP